jgi:hypothetical protein
MASERQIEANRRNARHSRGPRSAHGKWRASRNALRHGLAMPNSSPAYLRKLEKLAQRIAGVGANPRLLELARTVARAEFDLLSVQRMKVALIERAKATGALAPPRFFRSLMQEVRWTQQMFRWTIGSRPTEPPRPIVVNALPPMPVEEPARTAEACRRVLTELLRLTRYETRAISRRDRAIREMIKAKAKSQTVSRAKLPSSTPDLAGRKPVCRKVFTICAL